jgi:hypothetical protein
MNVRKANLKEEKQKNLTDIQQLQHKLSIAAGELKTETESVKLELMTKYATGIALFSSFATILLIKFL